MSGKVLVVEDNPDVSEMLVELLGANDLTAEIAPDGMAALERLESETFDLIVCDWKMPRLDGEGLYRALAKHHPRYVERVIFVTGSGERCAFLAGSTVPVIRKPFDFDQFSGLVK